MKSKFQIILTGLFVTLVIPFQRLNAQSDMVNLTTGDFHYTIPVLTVPGPEGGYQINLYYKGGIGTEQEASQVGLGWSLSAGSIFREVKQYPDDMNGDIQYLNQYAKIDHNLNVSYKDPIYNHQNQNYGMPNLNELNTWNSRVQMAMSIFNDIRMPFNSNPNLWEFNGNYFHVPTNVEKAGAFVQKIGTFINYATIFYNGCNALFGWSGSNDPYFKYIHVNPPDWTGSYDHGLNRNKNLKLYGSLYLQNIPTDSIDYSKHLDNQISSDMHLFTANPAAEVKDQDLYPSIAYDNYMVDAGDVSGTMRPYRLETGSLVKPRYSYEYATNVVPFVDYKVGFKYENEYANHYEWHKQLNFGLTYNTEKSWIVLDNTSAGDPTLSSSSSRVETRTDNTLVKNTLVTGKHIVWYSNKNIVEDKIKTDGLFLDFLPPVGDLSKKPEGFENEDRTSFRNAINCNDGIGGYSITNESGYTYHFSLPVYVNSYQYLQQTYAYLKDYSTLYHDSAWSYPNTGWYKHTLPKHAVTWLLTSITGPDFVDVNKNNYIDDKDKGYWVKFEYGRYAQDYLSQTPYVNYNPGKIVKNCEASRHYLFNSCEVIEDFDQYKSTSEKYYLNSIKTRTHTAVFVHEVRDDALSEYDANNQRSRSLLLHKIILLTNKDYDAYLAGKINNNGNSYETNNRFDKVWDTDDIDEFAVVPSQLKQVSFNYDYSLCTNTPSSLNFTGKLTLKKINFFERNNTCLQPSYVFSYDENNATENPKYWDMENLFKPFGAMCADDWGMYTKPREYFWHWTWAKDRWPFNHNKQPMVTSKGSEWSLKNIVTPIGTKISISYERDKYAEVCGAAVPEKLGGNNRVYEIKVQPETGGSTITHRYIYTLDGDPAGVSSGVCSVEPENCRSDNVSIYKSNKYLMFGFPATPVMYKKVTEMLYTGNDDMNIDQKTVYSFKTIDSTLFDTEKLFDKKENLGLISGVSIPSYYRGLNAKVNYRTARIGRPESIESFNKLNQLNKRITYTYDDDGTYYASLGKYTSGAIFAESDYMESNGVLSVLHAFRNTSIYYPNILKSTITVDNSGTTISKINSYDSSTGLILEKESTSPNDITQRVRNEYAFTKYPELGSSIVDPSYKNNLNSMAATYTYNVEGAIENLLNASIQSWKGNWAYRNNSNGGYSSDDESGIWRSYKSYIWNGDLDKDGKYKNFTGKEFNWALTDLDGNSSNGWTKTGEATLFNHYSVPLEVKDINNKYTATRLGYNESHAIASAANSNYASFTYSGFENFYPNNYFDGEFNASSSVSTENAIIHTGLASAKLLSGASVIYSVKPDVILKGKTYVASVWVYKASDVNASLNIKLQAKSASGAALVLEESKTRDQYAFKAGDWYLLSAQINVPADFQVDENSYLRIALYNNDATAPSYFDDAMLKPMDAKVVAYSFDDKGNTIAVINDNNLGVKSDYDEANRLTATYKETPQGFVLVNQQKYSFAKALSKAIYQATDFTISPSLALIDRQDAVLKATYAGPGAKYQWVIDGVATPSAPSEGYGTYTNPIFQDGTNPSITLNVVDAEGKTSTVTKTSQVLYLSVRYPGEGDLFYRNTNMNIEWYGPTGNYKVELQNLENSITKDIGTSTTNKLQWVVPSDWTISNNCKIKVTNLATDTSALSDQFSIGN